MLPEEKRATDAARDRRPRVRHRLRTPQEARVWRRRVTGYVLFAAAFVLMVNALVGENGYLATLQARGDRDKLLDQIARMRIKNQQMREEIHDIRTDPKALEEAARRELNMMKPGETMVILKDAAPGKATPK